MAAHTPAPWRACVWDPMERPHVHKGVPPDEQVCCPPDLPLNAADAYVMAAAPDLLAALVDLVDVIDRLGTVRLPKMDAARAAIAKATGGEP